MVLQPKVDLKELDVPQELSTFIQIKWLLVFQLFWTRPRLHSCDLGLWTWCQLQWEVMTLPWWPSAWIFARHWPTWDRRSASPSPLPLPSPFPWTPGKLLLKEQLKGRREQAPQDWGETREGKRSSWKGKPSPHLKKKLSSVKNVENLINLKMDWRSTRVKHTRKRSSFLPLRN